jgi:hypothetical protein
MILKTAYKKGYENILISKLDGHTLSLKFGRPLLTPPQMSLISMQSVYAFVCVGKIEHMCAHGHEGREYMMRWKQATSKQTGKQLCQPWGRHIQ